MFFTRITLLSCIFLVVLNLKFARLLNHNGDTNTSTEKITPHNGEETPPSLHSRFFGLDKIIGTLFGSNRNNGNQYGIGSNNNNRGVYPAILLQPPFDQQNGGSQNWGSGFQEPPFGGFNNQGQGINEENFENPQSSGNANLSQRPFDQQNWNPNMQNGLQNPQSGQSFNQGQLGNQQTNNPRQNGNQGSTFGNQGSGLGDQGSSFDNQGSGLGDQGSSFGNQESGFGNQGSGLGDQGSSFGNQESGFGNQGSGFSNKSPSFGNQVSDGNRGPIRNEDLGFVNQGTTFGNHQRGMGNQETGFGNQAPDTNQNVGLINQEFDRNPSNWQNGQGNNNNNFGVNSQNVDPDSLPNDLSFLNDTTQNGQVGSGLNGQGQDYDDEPVAIRGRPVIVPTVTTPAGQITFNNTYQESAIFQLTQPKKLQLRYNAYKTVELRRNILQSAVQIMSLTSTRQGLDALDNAAFKSLFRIKEDVKDQELDEKEAE